MRREVSDRGSQGASPAEGDGLASGRRHSTSGRLRDMRVRRGVLAALVIGPVLAGVIAAVIGARAVAHSDADESRLAFRLTSAEIASTLTLAI